MFQFCLDSEETRRAAMRKKRASGVAACGTGERDPRGRDTEQYTSTRVQLGRSLPPCIHIMGACVGVWVTHPGW